MKYQAQMKKKFETYLREMYFNLDCFKESSYTRYSKRCSKGLYKRQYN